MKKILGMLGTLGLMVSPVAAATTVISCGTSDIDIIDWSKVLSMKKEELIEIQAKIAKEIEKLPKNENKEDVAKLGDDVKIHGFELVFASNINSDLIDLREDPTNTNEIIIKQLEEASDAFINETIESIKNSGDINNKVYKTIKAYIEKAKKDF